MFKFPWGDMHSLNLGWFLQKFNELREYWATAEAGIDGALDAEIQRAEDALSDVFDARDAAAASASAANSSALNASQSSLASMDARDQSIAARNAAQQAATNAAASETAAGNSATAASNSATAAATSATAADNSANSASSSATAAEQEATNAAGSATAAAGSATAAADSATAAAASAAAAEEVEQSIPEDYTTLSNNVTALQADVSPIKQLAPLAVYPEDYLPDVDTTIHGRKFVRTGNKLSISYASASTTSRFYAIYRKGTINYNTSLPNLRNDLALSTFIPNPKNIAMSMAVKVKMHNRDGTPRPFPTIYLIYESATTPGTKYSTTLFQDATEYEDASISLGFDMARTGGSGFVIVINHDNSNIELEYEILLYNDEAKNRTLWGIAGTIQREYIALENKSINDLVIINNLLYKVTAPVSTGETYVTGTNIARTTITELLTQLLNS